jgi:lysophospholipase L1-like esterase
MLRQLFCALSILCLPIAAAEDRADSAKNARYLALGDSLAFGYSPLVVPVDLNQYHGYPEIVSKARHIKLANASCFGETSGHFLDLSVQDLGCQQWRANFPLFVSYTGTQMDYAAAYLSSNPKAELVTIDIGLNDLAVLLKNCNGNTACALAGAPAVLAAYGQNLFTIYSRIRGSGYQGPIVGVTAYAFDYSDPVQVGGILPLNGILSGTTTAFGGKVADVFTAFATAAVPFGGKVCATGLLVKLPDGTCDTHPSVAGQALIAKTVLANLDGDNGDGEKDHNDN